MAQPFYGGPGGPGPGGPPPGYMGGPPQGMQGGPPVGTQMQGPGMPMPGMGRGMPPGPGPMQGMPGGCPPHGCPPHGCPPQYSQGPGGPGMPQPGFPMPGPETPGLALETFVEISPEVQPVFRREQDGTFSLQVPRMRVKLATSCTPPPPAEPGLEPFKPYEEFWLDMPEVSWVVFNPWTGTPPGGAISAESRKRGAVLEVSPQVTLNAKLKANSPYGTLVVEDYQVDPATGVQQKVGETPLTYQLKVEGALSVNKGAGNRGANRLEVDLHFVFMASMSTKGSDT